MRIGFIGLGNMGLPMARNLLGLGHDLTVYNRTPGKAKPLLPLGAREAGSIAEVAQDAEVVITMLASDEALAQVVYSPGGLLQHLPAKAIHLCMGTVEVETSAALASAHTKAGQGYVAAPIFGRADAIEARRVWIVAGGPEPQVNRCVPIFVALGRDHTRVGSKASLAHALKLGGDLLYTAMEDAVLDMLAFAEKAGMTPANYLRLLNTAVFKSHLVDATGAVSARPSFDPADKTLDLAANEMLFHAAKRVGVEVPTSDLLNARLQAAGARGWGEQDLAALSEDPDLLAALKGPQGFAEEVLVAQALPSADQRFGPMTPAAQPPPDDESQEEASRSADPGEAAPPEVALPMHPQAVEPEPAGTLPIVDATPDQESRSESGAQPSASQEEMPDSDVGSSQAPEPPPVPAEVPMAAAPAKPDTSKIEAPGRPAALPPVPAAQRRPNPARQPPVRPIPARPIPSRPTAARPTHGRPILAPQPPVRPAPVPPPVSQPVATPIPIPQVPGHPVPFIEALSPLVPHSGSHQAPTVVLKITKAPPAKQDRRKSQDPKKSQARRSSDTKANPVAAKAQPAPPEPPSIRAVAPSASRPPLSPGSFTALDGGQEILMELDQTTHFEVVAGQVWAWTRGKRCSTSWRSLHEVELAFKQVLFLPIKRHLLLRPEAVQNLRPTFGGGAKAQMGDNVEIDVGRAAATRLKELLGL